jgi:NAD(P)-dependent dehydrogenase (short-subunit alcohol dehydrogenase family)
MRLQDKVTIITGAADGIGLACAKRFCAEGAKVVLSDINDAKGEAEATELKESGHQAEFAYGDVSENSDVEKLVDATVTHRGKLDCLVANASIVHVAGQVVYTDGGQLGLNYTVPVAE